MKWLYHIPHVWDAPTDRHIWEDVYLLPLGAPEGTPSIWFTLDGLGNCEVSGPGADNIVYCPEVLSKLNGSEWYINDTDMIVSTIDFNVDELLGWARIWLRENGFECTELLPAPIERFAGTNDHAALASGLKSNLDDGDC